MSLALYILYLWFTSNQNFAKMAASSAPGKNVNPMALSTSGPNLVLLEESEPNSPFIAITTLTINDLEKRYPGLNNVTLLYNCEILISPGNIYFNFHSIKKYIRYCSNHSIIFSGFL